MNFGFLKVAAAVPKVKIADPNYNCEQIAQGIAAASRAGVSVVAFPELAVTGYSCGDLFGQPFLIAQAERALSTLLQRTAQEPVVSVVGLPVAVDGALYNMAVVLGQGKIFGAVPKSYLPNYNEFYEARWFAPSDRLRRTEITLCGESVPCGTDLLFDHPSCTMALEICEDLWVPVPPSCGHAMAGADLLINLSASNEMVGKHDYLRGLIAQQSARTLSAYLYVSAGFGESSTDVVFAGNGMIAENGLFLQETPRFTMEEQMAVADVDLERMQTLRRRTNTFEAGAAHATTAYRRIALALREDAEAFAVQRTFNPRPFIPQDPTLRRARCEEIFQIQVAGLAQRLLHTQAGSAVVGISGGLDSTLALLVTVQTFDRIGVPRSQILGVTMPGFGTTTRTHTNAVKLMETLGVEVREIPIHEACAVHFRDIGLDPQDRSVTYENAQARERTQLLMDLANQRGGLVIGTGDLSELALGWATYNGDHMSMYGVNGGIPKTLVRYLVEWVADQPAYAQARPYLLDIVETPISPELLPADAQGDIAQKTEDLVGPYALHDFFLYHFVRFGERPAKLYWMACRAFEGTYEAATVRRWLGVFLRRFFTQQFKRSALPDGPKVGSITLSPRGDWRMPSDATVALWLKEVESLEEETK
ncbi:MAG: NAD(+) synthase [Alistipes sp.]|nr:NAD(+) synthase [Alistipes sp.]